MTETYSVTHYGVVAGEHDSTPAVRHALQQMQGKAARLVFPQGRYHFWPDGAEERYVFPSNNDPGLKRIAFPLLNCIDMEIDGSGSEFIFHGRIVPFMVDHCRSVRLHSFSIDWERTFHNEGEVLEVTPNLSGGMMQADFRIPAQFPYQVQYGRLQFQYEGYNDPEEIVIGNLLEFNPTRRETAFGVTDNYGVSRSYHAEEREPGIVRLTGKFSTVPTPGNVMSIGGNARECPAIVVDQSTDVALSDITIHHCGGMGVIAQLTQDIRLERVNVTPSERDGCLRMISTTADATHFVCCRGRIEMENCLFENQLDDATNVHGVYGRIARIVPPHDVLIEWVHPQQQGMDIVSMGDTVEFVQKESLHTYHQSVVTAARRINSQFCQVTLASALPSSAKPGDAMASLTGMPEVVVRGCTTRGNRARAFLLSTPGRTLVENNHFHAPGAAIVIAGDAKDWFESGGVRDVLIRNNHFDNCNYGVWGGACIAITPEIEPEHRAGNNYHQNIRIENNTFNAFDPRLVQARCVDGLTFRGNTIRSSKDYPAPSHPGGPFHVEDCQAVEIEGNMFADAAPQAVAVG